MISVCIATYNGSEYIVDQINSILPQLNELDEIIVSDDCSTDNTIELVEGIKDSRIKIFKNTGDKGYSSNFENALGLSVGEYIFLCDQDDIWLPNKVEVMLDVLESGVDFAVHDAKVVNSNLEVLSESIFRDRKAKPGFINQLIKIGYLGCCMAFNRKVLNYALPFPLNRTYVTHDSWLTLISESYFKVRMINTPLILYRRHDNNVSLGGKPGDNKIFKKVMIRLYSVYHLMSRLNKKRIV
ncbi:glycosyltransferase family 2 protein [Vibrio breoganii]